VEGNDEIEEIHAVTRFVHGSHNLTAEAPSNRLALLSDPLIRNGVGDSERAGILLNDHVDLLLELVQDRAIYRVDGSSAE
jgi:hypothetical protein